MALRHHDAAYYRGAMGILLVYSVDDEASFNNVRNWMKNIETHASSSVNKVWSAGSDQCLYANRLSYLAAP